MTNDKGAEHEKRASRYDYIPFIRQNGSESRFFEERHLDPVIDDLIAKAHAAGFEAGLKARLPSESTVEAEATARFGSPTYTSEVGVHWCRYKEAFKQGVAWLAANMRKGDV